MMSDADIEYYDARMRAERRAARVAAHPLAARSHDRLADLYAAMIRPNLARTLN